MLNFKSLLSPHLKAMAIGIIAPFLLTSCSLLPTQQISQATPSQQAAEEAPPEALSPISNGQSFNLKWQKKIPAVLNGYRILPPQVKNQGLYTAGADTVFALNKDTGAEIWNKKLGENITAGIRIGSKNLFLGTEHGSIVAFSPTDGATRWIKLFNTPIVSISNQLENKVAFRTINGKVILVDADSGEVKWQHTESTKKLTITGASSPLLIGPYLVSAFDNGKLIAYSIDTGEKKWETQVASRDGLAEIDQIVDLDAEMAAIGTAAFVSSANGTTSGVDLRNGKVGWKAEIASTTGFDVNEQGLYLTDREGYLYKLNPLTGKEIWKNDSLLRRQPNQPTLVAGKQLVIADAFGYIHVINTQGETTARVQADTAGYINGVNVAENQVYTQGKSGLISTHTLK
ncbi:MAG: Outer membrane protein assembly factor BamB [uncultured Thiotrichaceae bacterium]|uniref:Outer membrane protein assembly factor BamB n=1 Tax=uncultured Thiotrichaceae bacterium TaxID=298394 RepID=A0A6S6U6V1_9GAMM|nr:MAG: Outer membrane protein assembly factor BamB [uncultured Thiotrichaceae bacterium]